MKNTIKKESDEFTSNELLLYINKIQTEFYDKFNDDIMIEQSNEEIQSERKAFLNKKNELLKEYKCISFKQMIKQDMLKEAYKCLSILDEMFLKK
jgi:glycyl-tRNA synthetase beta subunit